MPLHKHVSFDNSSRNKRKRCENLTMEVSSLMTGGFDPSDCIAFLNLGRPTLVDWGILFCLSYCSSMIRGSILRSTFPRGSCCTSTPQRGCSKYYGIQATVNLVAVKKTFYFKTIQVVLYFIRDALYPSDLRSI